MGVGYLNIQFQRKGETNTKTQTVVFFLFIYDKKSIDRKMIKMDKKTGQMYWKHAKSEEAAPENPMYILYKWITFSLPETGNFPGKP